MMESKFVRWKVKYYGNADALVQQGVAAIKEAAVTMQDEFSHKPLTGRAE